MPSTLSEPRAASYAPGAAYASNSAGGPITITRSDVGAYSIAFENVATSASGVTSAAAVSTYGSSTIGCTLASLATGPGTPR